MSRVRKRPARRRPASVSKQAARAAGRKLPLKRQRAAAAYVGPAQGCKADAMRMAGYQESTATHKQGQVFGDPRVQREVRRLLDEAGLTREHAVRRLYEATNAVEPRFWKGAPVAECVAHDIRLEAVRTYFELTGELRPELRLEVIVRVVAERVVQRIERYVPAEQRAIVLDEIVADLLEAARN